MWCRGREGLEHLNWQRQQEQSKAGQELYQLELQWGELVMKNYQLEVRDILLLAGWLPGLPHPVLGFRRHAHSSRCRWMPSKAASGLLFSSSN